MTPAIVLVPLVVLAIAFLARGASAGGYSGVARYHGRDVYLDRPAGAHGVVLFFHGNGADARVVGHALTAITRARRLALIVPQLGPSGQLGGDEPGGLGSPAALAKLLAWAPVPTGQVVVAAHSGGFTGATVAATGVGWSPKAIVLLDALYGGEPAFESFVLSDARRRFGNVYGPTTSAASLSLAARLSARLGARAMLDSTGSASSFEIASRRSATLASTASHGAVPQAYLGKFLDAYA